MTAEQRAKICKRMLWIIPGLIMGTVRMALLAAILPGAMALILK